MRVQSDAELAAQRAFEALKALKMKPTLKERLEDAVALKALDDAAKASNAWTKEAKAQGGIVAEEAKHFAWIVFAVVQDMLGDDPEVTK